MRKLKRMLALFVVSACSLCQTWAQGTEESPIVVTLLEPDNLGFKA